jgi:pilus assembly protein CpaE
MNSLQTTAQDKIRVLVVAGGDPTGDWMAQTIALDPDMSALGLARDVSQVLDLVQKLSPDVILLDISSGILHEGDLINRLSAPLSGAAVIAVAMMGEVDMVRRAMLYGAQGFLLKPFGEMELLSSVRQAYDLIVQRRAEISQLPALPPGSKAAPPPRAELIAVFSPKGGVGCTTVAINLAVALKQISGQPVTLVDGDLRFGDIDTALNISATANLGTVLAAVHELDKEALDRALVKHSSGVEVLIAPPYLDMADAIDTNELKELLTRLSGRSDGYLVVDAWSALDDWVLALLDSCHYLVVVTTPQVTALRDTHRFLDALRVLNYNAHKILLVINDCYQRSNVKPKDLERILGHPIAQMIDYAPYQITASLNQGLTLIQEYGSSPAAQNIWKLAELITNDEAQGDGRWRMEVNRLEDRREPAARRGRFFRGR